MPDEVGLQIDHIIPVAKGGKSVSSNLRVLCNKCNASKGAK
jgi:5-methylcytosine-specific restriction endonuclease McrA